mmetsp:Transcript_148077/g.369176  ORF Transcript_148077/g.369176 Transcript_148077/m.369176 type:complete len:292 (-) Transcript_148077:1462-2337(-)
MSVCVNEALCRAQDLVVDASPLHLEHVVHAIGGHHEGAGIINGYPVRVLQCAQTQGSLIIEATLRAVPSHLSSCQQGNVARRLLQALLIPTLRHHAIQDERQLVCRSHEEATIDEGVVDGDWDSAFPIPGTKMRHRVQGQTERGHDSSSSFLKPWSPEFVQTVLDRRILIRISCHHNSSAFALSDDFVVPLEKLCLRATPIGDVGVHENHKFLGSARHLVFDHLQIPFSLRLESLPLHIQANILETPAWDTLHGDELALTTGLHGESRRPRASACQVPRLAPACLHALPEP